MVDRILAADLAAIFSSQENRQAEGRQWVDDTEPAVELPHCPLFSMYCFRVHQPKYGTWVVPRP